jgi:hypothetical protein
MHENSEYYWDCRHRERNMGLFTADRVSNTFCFMKVYTPISKKVVNAIGNRTKVNPRPKCIVGITNTFKSNLETVE